MFIVFIGENLRVVIKIGKFWSLGKRCQRVIKLELNFILERLRQLERDSRVKK